MTTAKKICITGAGGVVGSIAAEHFHDRGYEIISVDNDLRGHLLGDERGSTRWNIERLSDSLSNFRNHSIDVRDQKALAELFEQKAKGLDVILHCAAQPSHEGDVRVDFDINAMGTLNLLELWRRLCPEALFVYLSTIKVYGSYPNSLDYVVTESRLDLPPDHPHFNGFDENIPMGQGMSSFFGRSKTAADFYVQEYIHQYGLRGMCLRASCLTGGHHSGTEAHGMLSYIVRCAVNGTPYRIYGYDGLQVRDQLHAIDLVSAIDSWIEAPRESIVYNIGGGRANACSILEAIDLAEAVSGRKMTVSVGDQRRGDHPWWITDNSRLRRDYPSWKPTIDTSGLIEEIYATGRSRWLDMN